MSGSVGYLYIEQVKKRKQAMLARQKASALKQNREQAIALVLTAFGWTKLEPWAEQRLNVLFNGGMIDLKEFAELLQEWKKEQLAGETTENGDNAVQEG